KERERIPPPQAPGGDPPPELPEPLPAVDPAREEQPRRGDAQDERRKESQRLAGSPATSSGSDHRAEGRAAQPRDAADAREKCRDGIAYRAATCFQCGISSHWIA